MQTPRFCGQPCNAGLAVLYRGRLRPARTSWLNVGIFALPFFGDSHTPTSRMRRPFALSLEAGSGWRNQPCFPPCFGGKLLLTFGPAADGGAKPTLGEALRFASTALHSYSTGGIRAGRFQRGHLRRNFEDVFLIGSTALSAPSRNDHAQPQRRPQISQDDSRNLFTIATEFFRRQLRIPAISTALLKMPTASRLENSRTRSHGVSFSA